MADHVELPLPGGLSCCVPDDASLLSNFVLREQLDWFEDEIAFVRTLVRSGDHVVDIGANFGTYTLSLGRAVGPDGSVQAFEPASVPSRLLRRSLELNRMPWVRLHVLGLSDHPGEAEMSISSNSELNSLTAAHDASEKIRLTTLDEALAGQAQAISFIKMDAEGEEERILAASQRFFAAHDPVVMFELKHGTANNDGLCEAFMRRGFLIKRLLPGLNALAPIPLGEAFDGFLLNAFAMRPSAEAALEARGLLLPLKPLPLEQLPPLRVNEVIAALARAPWAAPLAPAWQPDAAQPGWDEHRRAVALGRTAADPSAATPVQRHACLRHALLAERKALGLAVNGSRLFTIARLLFDLGQRSEGVAALQQAVGAILDGGDPVPAFREPFLLPLAAHEALAAGSLRELVTIAALEALAWKSTFSAYFSGLQQRPLYQRIVSSPLCHERSRRALALLDERAGASGPRYGR